LPKEELHSHFAIGNPKYVALLEGHFILYFSRRGMLCCLHERVRPMKERIQKILAAQGIASRRAVEEMVVDGRITVNGKTVYALPVMIDPSKDKVTVDGEPVKLKKQHEGKEDRIYILMHKPKNVFCTNVAQGVQKRAIDLLPPNFPRVYPVGRLDHDSRGLLLLTNDGDLTNKLTHPKFGVPKTYRAAVDGTVSPATLEKLKTGVWLAEPGKGGFKTGRSSIRIIHKDRESTVLEISIREGRNRQVRRMMSQVGHKVRDLMRIKMGPLELKGLAVGQFRPLTFGELKSLQQAPEKEREAMEDFRKRANAREARTDKPAETKPVSRPAPARRKR